MLVCRIFLVIIPFIYGQGETLQNQDYRSTRLNEKETLGDISENITSKHVMGKYNEDALLSIDAILLKYNQSVESHHVKTEDGYILKMFRIPNNGTPVFLMHGLFSSADDFVTAGPESGLAYLLAKQGYDVWMGNARGNKHSRRNDHLNPLDPKFWNFSWHEIGVYDLPAMIDYVLEKTGQKSLRYIGHSQGTTSFFVLASERPEYNEKIAQAILLSPVAFMSNMKSPILRLMASSSPFMPTIVKQMGTYEFNPDIQFTKFVRSMFCGGFGSLSGLICSNVVFLFVGFDFGQLNVTNLPVVYGHFPSSISVKQMLHYGQGVTSGRFAKYDNGINANIKMYGSRGPPEYDLSKITTPVYFMYSDNDWMSDTIDVKKLSKRIGCVTEMYKIPYKKFNHLDFLFANDVKTLVYEKVFTILKN